MEEEIKRTFKNYKIGLKNPIVLAVSGGVDSVVLLDLASKILPKDKIVVAHVNHGLRKESEKEEQFVKELAKKYQTLFFKKRLNLKKAGEEQARKKRYEFLREVKEKVGASYIVTAHHLNDQVETIILKLVRGSGPIEVWGMNECENDILRPLLDFSKREIEAYAEKNKLRHVIDPSNKNLSFSRNRIRLKVIPELEKINPNFLLTLENSTKAAREAADFLSRGVEKAAKSVKKGNVLDIKKLKKLPSFIQKEVVRKSLVEMKGKNEGVYEKNVAKVLELMERSGTKKTEMFGFVVEKDYNKITFGKVKEKIQKSAKIFPGKGMTFNGFKIRPEFVKSAKPAKNNILLPTQIAYNLNVRTWHPGDKIKTASGSKKLQDVFVNAKVSQDERKKWPIIVFKDKILWIPLLAASKDVTRETRSKVLKIEVKNER